MDINVVDVEMKEISKLKMKVRGKGNLTVSEGRRENALKLTVTIWMLAEG